MPAHRTRETKTLEVSTTSPPDLTIISPTPRAFAFPINHDLHDSPYASPACSPFEPDLATLALSSATPPPPLLRTLSPPIPSSSHFTHKRRKSASSDITERRPKKGDDDYVKRPENAFILFRRKCCEDRQAAHEEAAAADAPTKKQRQADLSKTISQQWKSLPAEERSYWEDLAKEKKKEHEAMYPNYVYRPQRIKDPKGLKGRKSGSVDLKLGRRPSDHEFESENDSVSFILPFSTPLTRQHGRSASAPTPPLGYQQIIVPNVYMPSCPTSPSLMPMIARRSSHPGHTGSHFDYLPRETSLLPPSFAQEFQPPLHSTDFFQDMFNMTGQPPSTTSTTSPSTTTSPPTLHRLTVPDHPILQQTISPSSSIASGSSGPPSPNNSPYTPTMFSNDDYPSLHHPHHHHHHRNGEQMGLQLPDLVDYPVYGWENNIWEVNTGTGSGHSGACGGLDADIGLNMGMGMSSMSMGGGGNGGGGMNGMGMGMNGMNAMGMGMGVGMGMGMGMGMGAEMLIGEDFDLASIPPIELGLSSSSSKMGDELELELELSAGFEGGDTEEGYSGGVMNGNGNGNGLGNGNENHDECDNAHHAHHAHAHAHPHSESLDGLFGYDEMMASRHRGY